MQRSLEAISILLCPHRQRHKTHSGVHWAKTKSDKIHLQQCKSNIFLCNGENLSFVNWEADIQLVYLASTALNQFIFAENLAHNFIFIFLLLWRFTYIHIPFGIRLIQVTREKRKRDVYKYPSKTYRIWIRSFPWIISGMRLEGNSVEFNC